jgi:hypothetical protein
MTTGMNNYYNDFLVILGSSNGHAGKLFSPNHLPIPKECALLPTSPRAACKPDDDGLR